MTNKPSCVVYTDEAAPTRRINAPYRRRRYLLAAYINRSRGNRAVAWVNAALDVVTRFLPDYPHSTPMLEKRRKEKWL
jgi:hypothetical protein